jgi:tetratricopeptide (TPR) repeat protein
MKAAVWALTLILPAAAPAPQDVNLRTLFESGKHEQVVERVSGMEDPDPAALYLAALSHQKLSRPDEAKALYGRLAGRDNADAWHHIGTSGRLLLESNAKEAITAANKAVKADANLAYAHYQAGLAYGQAGDFAKAAAAFEKAGQLAPEFAYAHYHAGLSYYRAKRVDLMATHFEAFLKTAPEAPERPEVESIMRTVRGR